MKTATSLRLAGVLRLAFGASSVVMAVAQLASCRPPPSNTARPGEVVPTGASTHLPVEASPSANAAAVGGPSARPERCARDADCIVTDFAACCSVCGRGNQRAALAWKVAADEASCAAVECPPRPPGIACAAPSGFNHPRAVCRVTTGDCELIDGGAPSAGIRIDDAPLR